MKIVELLKGWHDQFLELAGDLKFEKRDPVDLNRIALYGSVLEFSSAILILLENNGRSALPSVFRSLLESCVELRNLAKDPEYINHMRASHADQWLKIFREADAKDNPYLAGIAGVENLDEVTAEYESNLAALVKAGFRPLNVYQRFEKADMTEEYRSLYNFLSCDAHSNIRALITRHIEPSEDEFEVVYYKDEPIETFLATLDSTAGLLYQATLTIHECFESEHVERIKAMLDELTNVRSDYVL